MKTFYQRLSVLSVIGIAFADSQFSQLCAQNAGLIDPPPWARHYSEGERIGYHMKAVNQDRAETRTYEVDAKGSVKRGEDGQFFEEYSWSNYAANQQSVELSAGAKTFRQHLALPLVAQPADFMKIASAMAELGKLDGSLVGPVADLTTFYIDLLFCSQFGGWAKAGDHRFIDMAGQSNSWADGHYIIIAEDSINFDCTVTTINDAQKIATLTVKHMPPEKARIKLPAPWMRNRVADTENNWVEVKKNKDGTYTAAVGQESFVVVLKVSLTTGKIISAKMDNPVEVVERQCKDADLIEAGEPQRYQIRRQIELTALE